MYFASLPTYLPRYLTRFPGTVRPSCGGLGAAGSGRGSRACSGGGSPIATSKQHQHSTTSVCSFLDRSFLLEQMTQVSMQVLGCVQVRKLLKPPKWYLGRQATACSVWSGGQSVLRVYGQYVWKARSREHQTAGQPGQPGQPVTGRLLRSHIPLFSPLHVSISATMMIFL
jgi:hypothetical protein